MVAGSQVQNFSNEIPCVSTNTAKTAMFSRFIDKNLYLRSSDHVSRNSDLILQFGPPWVLQEARLSIYTDIFRCLSSGLMRKYFWLSLEIPLVIL